jgi:hypothetical protein
MAGAFRYGKEGRMTTRTFATMSVFRSRLLLTAGLAACVGVMVGAGTAFAHNIPTTSLFFQMTGVACAPQCGGNLNETPSFTTQNGPTVDKGEALLEGAGNNAFVSGFSDFGRAGVFAHVETEAQQHGNGIMLAVAAARWIDFVTPTSPTLPAGTPVQVTASFGMDGIANASGGFFSPSGNPNAAGITATWIFNSFMFSDFEFSPELCAGDPSQIACGVLPPGTPFHSDGTMTFNLEVGQTFIFTGQLQVVATADSFASEDGAFASSSVDTDASRTGEFFLQPLGDFTLVTASGHDYSPTGVPSSPVPQPAALILVGLGAATLGVLRRRRE